jgi:hypothetical protein
VKPEQLARSWQSLACALLVGTLGNAMVGIVFRLLLTLWYRGTSQSATESPAIYATWPLFWSFVGMALSPRELAFGAIAGIGFALVRCLKRPDEPGRIILSSIVFLGVTIIRSPWSFVANPALETAGNLVRGAFLGWLTAVAVRKWVET